MTAPPRQAPDRIDGRVGAIVATAAWLVTVFAIWLAWVALQANSSAIARAYGSNGSNARAAVEPFPPVPAAPMGDVPIERSLIDATEIGLARREAQRASLERWGWVDRARGRAEIPIEQAMELVIEEAGGP